MSDRVCIICGKVNPYPHQDFCENLGCSGRMVEKRLLVDKKELKPEVFELRDRFAGQAMLGAIRRGFAITEEVAVNCYKQADAMLKARESTRGDE